MGEVTEMQIKDLVNESIGETEEILDRRLLGSHKLVNKGCSREIRFPCGNFPSQFGILIAVMELPIIIAHCFILLIQAHGGKRRRGW